MILICAQMCVIIKCVELNEASTGVSMNNKIIGIILVIAGAALALWGYNIYDAASSQVTRAISGDTPIEAWIGMVGGAVCVIVGLTRLK